jgi:ABC-type transport system involved in multi-copper enzyme maturation permease subunit
MSAGSWTRWRRQAWAVARHELGRALLGRRVLPVLLLVAMPLSLAGLRALFLPGSQRADLSHSTADFAQMFALFHLRFVVFFACALLFAKLFRGEILERSLHYSLLAPVRREVLVAGKYVGGVIAAWLVLLSTTALTFVLFHLPHGAAGIQQLLSPTGASHLAGYLAVVALACCAYGALFLLAGLYFGNPMVPGLLFLGWEVATPFLPPALKALSVVHYLSSLLPVPPSLGPLALLSRPIDPWLAGLGLLAATAVLLVLAVRKARRLEVTYAAE